MLVVVVFVLFPDWLLLLVDGGCAFPAVRPKTDSSDEAKLSAAEVEGEFNFEPISNGPQRLTSVVVGALSACLSLGSVIVRRAVIIVVVIVCASHVPTGEEGADIDTLRQEK